MPLQSSVNVLLPFDRLQAASLVVPTAWVHGKASAALVVTVSVDSVDVRVPDHVHASVPESYLDVNDVAASVSTIER